MTDVRSSTTTGGVLSGVRVVELGGIGPGPFCGMLLADHGADVIRIERPGDAGRASAHPVLHRNRRSMALDLKDPDDLRTALRLVDTADILLEGFRPGVAERLGLGPEVCLERNPRLVYGRMTGWGQDGPLADEPGHDINYIAVAGALGAFGPGDAVPTVPLNLVGDMGGGGLLLAFGITAALVSVAATGRGQVVDAAMTDGTAVQLSLVHGLHATGRWAGPRGANLFDGGAPFYRAYRCCDGRFVAVGSVEPQFYRSLVVTLGLQDDPTFADQHDRAAWPEMGRRLAVLFATRTRDEWADLFTGRGACVSPVLGLVEAADHPHNKARGTLRRTTDGGVEPAPAPRFSATPAPSPRPAPVVGAHTAELLADLASSAVDD